MYMADALGITKVEAMDDIEAAQVSARSSCPTMPPAPLKEVAPIPISDLPEIPIETISE
jgi:hypothetical protein